MEWVAFKDREPTHEDCDMIVARVMPNCKPIYAYTTTHSNTMLAKRSGYTHWARVTPPPQPRGLYSAMKKIEELRVTGSINGLLVDRIEVLNIIQEVIIATKNET